MRDKRRLNLYMDSVLLEAIDREAVRLDRSHSWVVQYALRHRGIESVKALPSLAAVSG